MIFLGARVAAMENPSLLTVWHGADGGTYLVDAAAMVAISDVVQAHFISRRARSPRSSDSRLPLVKGVIGFACSV